jgi:hypothetical protein
MFYYFNDELVTPWGKFCHKEIKTYINYEICIPMYKLHYVGSTDNRKGMNLGKRVSFHLNNTLADVIKENDVDKNDIICNIIKTHDSAHEALQYERLLIRTKPDRYNLNTSNGGEGIKYKVVNYNRNKINELLLEYIIENHPDVYKKSNEWLRENHIIK